MAETIDVEYVGDPPVVDEVTRYMLATKQVHPEAAAVLRGAEMQRNVAVIGVTKRVVDPEWFGTSRQYVFGPACFTVAVDKEDVDKIKGSSDGHQFRIVGDPLADVFLPDPRLRVIDDIEFSASELKASLKGRG